MLVYAGQQHSGVRTLLQRHVGSLSADKSAGCVQQQPLMLPRTPRDSSCAPLDTLLLNRTIEWALTSTGPTAADLPEWRLRLDDCALRRFTGRQARECLKNKTVVLIGDSLTR